MSDPADVHSGTIPDSYVEILEKKAFGHVATLESDGWAQVTPIWVDHDDGEALLFNTLRGRKKERNVREDPRVTVSVTDPDDPYRYLSVRGEATMTEEGADDHIDMLARKYMDVEEYPYREGEEGARVIVRVPADRVVTRGGNE